MPVRVLARDIFAVRARRGLSPELVPRDVTKPATLPPAFDHVSCVIRTAGVRSGNPLVKHGSRRRNTLALGTSRGCAASAIHGTLPSRDRQRRCDCSFATITLNTTRE